MRACFGWLVLAAIPFPALHAQDSTLLVGKVVSAAGSPLPYSTYSISPGGVRRFTNSEGAFSVRVPSRRSYRIAVRQLGYGQLDTAIVVGASGPVTLRLELHKIVFRLAAVRSVANRACATESRATELAAILDEVEKNAERELLLRNSYPFEYRLERSHRLETGGAVSRSSRDTLPFLSTALDPYRPGEVVRWATAGNALGRELRIPQLADFDNGAFLANHCFSYAGLWRIAGAPAYRIEFEPARDVGAPDVEGSVLLDTATLLMRRAFFSLTRGDRLTPPVTALEVTTTYRDLFKGVAIFDHIRSVQSFPHQRPTDPVQVQTEDYQVLGVRFLGRSPDELRDSALVASRSQPVPLGPLPVASGLSPSQRADSARRVVSALMEADLRRVGFFDRRSHFSHGIFLGLDEVNRRILADSTRLLPEVTWVQLGAAADGEPIRGGISINSRGCAVNVYINGRPVSVGNAEMARVRRSKVLFGPELPPSKLGAIELYPPGAREPQEFPVEWPRCGTMLLWTRPEPPASSASR